MAGGVAAYNPITQTGFSQYVKVALSKIGEAIVKKRSAGVEVGYMRKAARDQVHQYQGTWTNFEFTINGPNAIDDDADYQGVRS
jgi:hypothetical protein